MPRSEWVIFPHFADSSTGARLAKPAVALCAECVIEKLCPSSSLKTGVAPGSVGSASPSRLQIGFPKALMDQPFYAGVREPVIIACFSGLHFAALA